MTDFLFRNFFVTLLFVASFLIILPSCQNQKTQALQIQKQQIESLIKDKNWPKALEILKVLEPNNSTDFDITFNLALAHHHQGQIQLAKDYYTKAINLNPKHLKTLSNLASIFIKEKDFDKTLTYLKKAHEFHPDSFQVLNDIGSIYASQKNWEPAVSNYEKALTLQPKNHFLKTNLSYTYYNLANQQVSKQKNQKAKSSYQKAIDLNPKLHAAIKNLGLLYLKEGNMPKAWEIFNQSDKIRKNTKTSSENQKTP